MTRMASYSKWEQTNILAQVKFNEITIHNEYRLSYQKYNETETSTMNSKWTKWTNRNLVDFDKIQEQVISMIPIKLWVALAQRDACSHNEYQEVNNNFQIFIFSKLAKRQNSTNFGEIANFKQKHDFDQTRSIKSIQQWQWTQETPGHQ